MVGAGARGAVVNTREEIARELGGRVAERGRGKE